MSTMNSKYMIMACALALCGSVLADGNENAATEDSKDLNWAMGEGVSFGETPIASVEASLAFDSKFMSYGLVDNKDPIVTPSASITLFDHLTLEVAALFDVTKYGRKHGEYGNRAGKYMELDPGVSFGWSFSPDDYSWLPTTIETSLGYSYEYHPRSMGGGTGEPGDDTQFITAEIALPDLWLEPTLSFERDIDRDNGTYLNLELGHSFALIDSDNEDDDPMLVFRPSVAQGLGNTQRTRGYDLAEHHGGLMDLCVKGELTWNICKGIALSGYVAYYDYVFDSTLREAARDYEASGRDDMSYHFVAGLALTASF